MADVVADVQNAEVDMPDVHVDVVAERAVTTILFNIFDTIAYMDPDVVRHNIELACKGGMDDPDRHIRVELANYLMSNLAVIVAGLVVDQGFRSDFIDAVVMEMELDNMDPEFVSSKRKEMHTVAANASKGDFVLDLSVYNDGIYRRINEKISGGFFKMLEYDAAIDSFIADLSPQDKADIGFCVSNFMYVIRAFAKNDLFADYVKSVVKHVKDELGIGVSAG